MKYEDVPVGGEVILGGSLANSDITLMALFGLKVRVTGKGPPQDGNVVYPSGIVSLELPAGTNWPTREVFMRPEDLAPIPPWVREDSQ